MGRQGRPAHAQACEQPARCRPAPAGHHRRAHGGCCGLRRGQARRRPVRLHEQARPLCAAAAGGSRAAAQSGRVDLAKQMLAFGLPTLSISLADPAMSLVDTIAIGAGRAAGSVHAPLSRHCDH